MIEVDPLRADLDSFKDDVNLAMAAITRRLDLDRRGFIEGQTTVQSFDSRITAIESTMATDSELSAAIAALGNSSGGSGDPGGNAGDTGDNSGGGTAAPSAGETKWSEIEPLLQGGATAQQRAAAIALLDTLHSAGLWEKLHRCYSAITQSIEDVSVDWVTGENHQRQGSYTFVQGRGISPAMGSYPSARIRTGFHLSQNHADNLSHWVWLNTTIDRSAYGGQISSVLAHLGKGQGKMTIAATSSGQLVFRTGNPSSTYSYQALIPPSELDNPIGLGGNFVPYSWKADRNVESSGIYVNGAMDNGLGNEAANATISGSGTNNEFCIFGHSTDSGSSNRPADCDFLFGVCAEGLTEQECLDLHNAVNTYLTTLNVN